MTTADVVRPTWDEYFMAIAYTVASRADCRRRQIGCVITDQDNRILATGYNGSHPGGPSCLAGQCPRGLLSYEQQAPLTGGYHSCISTHAETNALLFARASCAGATIYITYEPCPDCWKLLRSARIARVVWPEGERCQA